MGRRALAGALACVALVGMAVVAHAAEAEPTGELLGTIPVADLDGDGGADVVTVHAGQNAPAEQNPTSVIVARRGADGTPLWSSTVPVGGIYAAVAPAGPSGQPGLYVVVSLFNFFVDAHTTQDSLVVNTPVYMSLQPTGIEALAFSATGQQIWRQREQQHAGDEPATTDGIPLAFTLAQSTASPATDVTLLFSDDHDEVRASSTQDPSTRRAVVLDGADGAQASVGTLPLTVNSGTSLAVGDLDGDGLADTVIGAGTAGVVAGYRGTDGSQLWRASGLDFDTSRLLSDVTGDGIRDVVTQHNPNPGSNPTPGEVTLLEGRTGTVRWIYGGDQAFAAGDLVGIATRFLSTTEAGTTYELVDAAGVGVAARDVSLARPPGATATIEVLTAQGDLNGDGVGDLVHEIVVGSGDTAQTEVAVVSGRTLGTLWTGPPVGTPLRAAVSPGGDDLVRTAPFGSSAVDVTVQDGATGADVWTARVRPSSETTQYTTQSAADLDGDGLAEVIVDVRGAQPAALGTVPDEVVSRQNFSNQVFVLDGRDGSLRWQR